MEDHYSPLIDHFSKVEAVELSTGRGARGIKYAGKMFAMFFKGELLLKMPEARVRELIDSGVGRSYEAVAGKPMSDRVLIGRDQSERWIALTEEALEAAMHQ